MSRKYITPEMEITEFETEDVITTSGGITGHEGAAGDNEDQGEFGDFFG